MKKRLLSALLCVLLVLSQAAALAAADYTVAEKLYKQLKAGSGFSAELTVDVKNPQGASVLASPLLFDVDAIYQAAAEVPSTRVDVTLCKEADAVSAAHLSLSRAETLLQADLLSPDWFLLSGLKPEEAASLAAPEGETGASLAATGMPQIAGELLKYAAALNGLDLSAQTDVFTTRVDLWLESFRQEAEIRKTEAGETTVTVSYVVPASALKAEAKTLALDLLENRELLNTLRDALSEEDAELLLTPAYREYYFAAIDALPLEGDLCIDRTVSLKGATLLLEIALPFHDAVTGDALLIYQRTAASGDDPETVRVAVEGPENAPSVEYSRYTGMTGVEVLKGVLSLNGAKTDFAFTSQITESRLETGEDSYACDFTLELTPQDGAGKPLQAALKAEFLSMTSKTAATTVKATLTVSPEGGNSVTAELEGKSRKKWEPEAISGAPVELAILTKEERQAYLSALLTNFANLALRFAK